MRIIATTAALALGAVMLTGSPAAADNCNGDPANPDCPVLGYADAAHVYLEFMCPVNKAGRKFARLVNKRSEGHFGRHPKAKTRAAAKRLAMADAAMAEAFSDGYTYAGFWPDEVADDMETIAQGAFTDAGIAFQIAKKSYRWSYAEWSDYDAAADNVRYTLGLPPRGADPSC